MKRNFLFGLLSWMAVTLLSQAAALAHFPWLVSTPGGRLEYFFGESLADRTYKLPESLSAAKVFSIQADGKRAAVKLAAVSDEQLIGLRGEAQVADDSLLVSQTTYGIYHGARLDYYTLHQTGLIPTSREAYGSRPTGLLLSAQLVKTSRGLDVYVTWNGKLLAGIEVHLVSDGEHGEASATSDDAGKVAFTDEQLAAGINGITLGHNTTEAGNLDGIAYATRSHYLTATFYNPQQSEPSDRPIDLGVNLPPLPIEITSFGAVRLGSSIFVYGGHTGPAHTYAQEYQNNKLLRLDTSRLQQGWQEIASGQRLQGLGMVAHGQRLIVIGGFTATNETGEDHDLRSQAAVRAYDLASDSWVDLPSLPEPRSSHDAAIIGDTIYVAGGWNLQGAGDADWRATAWSLNLKAENPTWVELAKPPFTRRALAVVGHQGKLFVLGGMDAKGGPTREVVMYDPGSKTWSPAGELQGEEPLAGFGPAAWSFDDQLLATTYEGRIQRWVAKQRSWEVIGQTQDARFFHRLLPLDGGRLVMIGGANMSQGKFVELETIDVPPTN